jgi:hypothetical protein
MSLALIQEAAKEVRRLSIAGSSLAVGDFRLKKLVAPLEQAGAKAPVFAQVARGIQELVNGNEANSATNLLQLSTLLNAILYTQGQTGAEGEFRELESFPSTATTTRATARTIKPLVQALTTSGSGRFEIIKSAVERSQFNDLRLIDPAIYALGDNYPEIAELVAEKILPVFGPGIAPRLRSTFDLKGKKHDARKLRALHRFDPNGTVELCKTALEDGSTEVKAAAVECLGQHPEYLPIVMQQSKAKNKEVRAAALMALAGHDDEGITKLFSDLLKGKTLEILVKPMRALRNRQVLNAMIEEGKSAFDAILKGDSEQISRFLEILDCLETRKEAETENFLLSCLARSDKLAGVKAAQKSVIGGAEIMCRLAVLLYDLGSTQALEAVLSQRGALPAAAFPQVLRSAIRSWTPEKVFAEFSPLLEQKKGPSKEMAGVLRVAVWSGYHADDADYYAGDELSPDRSDAQVLKRVQWDPRWLDAAIKADDVVLVCCLARPNHAGVIGYLEKAAAGKDRLDSGDVIAALARCQHPRLTDFFLELVTKRMKVKGAFNHELRALMNSAQYLPVADLPKLDAFAAGMDEKFVDAFLEGIAPLRRAAPNA